LLLATSEYHVIESADGTFTVELREITKRGDLLFKKDGFQTRQDAQAWFTPVEIFEPPWIARTATAATRTQRRKYPVVVIDNTTED
jgi:hypothetical protein